MKDRILFQSYDGNAPHIFLQFDRGDRPIASRIVNQLIDRQFRVCFDEHDPGAIADADLLADRILSSQLIVFLISAGALASLAFRNSINYALSKKKKIFCVYLDDEEPEPGIKMQLANVPGARVRGYPDIGALCDDVIQNSCFVQDMRGENATVTIQYNRRKKIAIGLLTAVLVLFLASAAVVTVYRIRYNKSLPGQIEGLTEVDYLDISGEDPSILSLLKGKSIKTLAARDMGLTDIEALADADCVSLDISDNPHVNTLEPLLHIEDLKTVTVTQDMYPAIIRVSGRHRFRIVIAR